MVKMLGPINENLTFTINIPVVPGEKNNNTTINK